MSDEYVINVRTLLWDILLRWRALFLCGLIGGLLLAGGKFGKEYLSYQNRLQEQKKTADNGEADFDTGDLTQGEISEVRLLNAYYEKLAYYQSYLAENLAMQQESCGERTEYRMQFYIQPEEETMALESDGAELEILSQEAKKLAAVYTNALSGSAALKEIIEASGWEISETDLRRFYSVGSDSTGSLLTIVIVNSKETNMDMEAAARSIEQFVEKKSKQLQRISRHKISLVDVTNREYVDTGLINEQTDVLNKVFSIQNNVRTMEGRISEGQKNYLRQLQESGPEKKMEAVTEGFGKAAEEKPGIHVKFAVLGAVLGIMLVCGFVFCRTLFSPRLLGEEEFSDRFKLKSYGTITTERKEARRPFDFVDRWLLSIRDRDQKKLSPDGQLHRIAEEIVLECAQTGISFVAITGSVPEKLPTDILEKIKELLQERKIQSEIVENPVYDSGALGKCAEIGNMVIVEGLRVSRYREVESLVQKANEYKIRVLGGIIFG